MVAQVVVVVVGDDDDCESNMLERKLMAHENVYGKGGDDSLN